MSARIPDEIISEILSPALQVPEHLFSDTSERSPFASQSSTSSTLLVCKSWLRVATPLLYSVVVIRSKAQAQALQKTFQNAPELGQFVKKLRVEGGFGQVMLKILQKTPNISDLVISLQLRAPDSSSGLVSGLSLIKLTRLIIVDYYFWQRPNKAVEALKTALGICVAGWKNLHTIRFPYEDIIIERKPFCMALCTALTVRILSFPMYKSSFVPVLTKIAQIPSLKAIEISTDEPQDGPPPPPLTNPRLNELIRWVGNSMIPRASAHQPATCARTDPTFRPMSSTPQVTADRIWCRILFFAMLSLEQHPENTLPWKLPDPKLNSRRLQFLLVSKLFHRLARPYLYRYPIFLHETSVPLFAGALAAHSSLCNEVLTLDVRRPPSREILWRIRSSWDTNALDPIFPHTRNLTHLIGGGDHSASISWDTFTALAKIAGGTLRQLTGFTICVQADDAPTRSAEAFRHLTAMRSLGWKCWSIPAPTPNALPKALPYASFRAGSKVSKVKEPPFFGVVGDLSSSALPALEVLCIKSPEVLPVMSQMKLTKLRHAAFEIGGDAACAFLKAHGAKLQHLEVQSATMPEQSILQLCPNITTFSCPKRSRLQRTPSQFFLTKITVTSPVIYGKAYEKQWADFFQTVDPTHMPALREMNVPAFEWPTTEHDIGKSIWVKGAGVLSERGIKLTDRTGSDWRPRLKTSRAGKVKQ